MNELDKHKLENQYATLMQQKLALILKKQMVPTWLNQTIKRLAQILGLSARYSGDPQQNFLYSLSKLYKKLRYVSEVVKYSAPATKENFQHILDKTPNDYVTRLVYADWLKEHNLTDEEEFQRSLADWHKGGNWSTSPHPTHPQYVNLYKLDGYPKGVSTVRMPHRNPITGGHYYPLPHNHPTVGLPNYPKYEADEVPILETSGGLSANKRWVDYKNMEGAFWKNFLTGKKMERGE